MECTLLEFRMTPNREQSIHRRAGLLFSRLSRPLWNIVTQVSWNSTKANAKFRPHIKHNTMQLYSVVPDGREVVWQKGMWQQRALAAKTHKCPPSCIGVKEQLVDQGKLFLPPILHLWVCGWSTVSHLGLSSTRRSLTYQSKFSGGPPQWLRSGELLLWWQAEGAGLVQPREKTALERGNLNPVSMYLMGQCREHFSQKHTVARWDAICNKGNFIYNFKYLGFIPTWEHPRIEVAQKDCEICPWKYADHDRTRPYATWSNLALLCWNWVSVNQTNTRDPFQFKSVYVSIFKKFADKLAASASSLIKTFFIIFIIAS